MAARFNVLPADERAVSMLEQSFELPHFIATTLAARGVTTPEQAQAFLNPTLEQDWGSPYDIQGMDEVVSALEAAIRQNKRILVFGDFDLDGISATSLTARALRELGADVVPFIPLRFEEGYGLTEAAIKRALTYEPDVLITVDNGIAAREEVKLLQQAGVEVLITDHHEPGGLEPVGVPLVDPKCGDQPDALLAGAGVALKVVQALGARFGKPHMWREYIDLATLGTVADLMPMRNQNRALVSVGLQMINDNTRPCITALRHQAGYADKPMTSTNLSFSLVPRLNAAGRMGNAQLGLDLLMCDEYAEASTLAAELEANNDRRRQIEAELAELAIKMAEETYAGERALIVAGEGWHEGVKGIVASRLCNRFGVPSILFTIEDGEARGSGRSVGEVNLFDAVASCEDLLTRFGGHSAAVGVTLPAENLPEFHKRLCAYMDALPAEDFSPLINIDAVVDIAELTRENVEKLDLIAPFGQENSTPRFLAHSVMLAKARAVGAQKNHLSCVLTDGRAQVAGIMFRCPNVDALRSCSSMVDAVFELQIDTWKGHRTVKANISQLCPVEPCAALTACLEADSMRFVDNLMETDEAEPEPEVIGSGIDAQEFGSPCECADNRACWQERARTNPQELRAQLLQELLGDAHLHESQKRVLDLLDAGVSVGAIMGTGRGKSLIFQLHAAQIALAENITSIFIYPLRALIADQAYRLLALFEQVGLQVRVLTGECSFTERAAIARELHEGGVDILLTTPEFLAIHAPELAQLTTFGFAVLDEAHHLATDANSNRPAYKVLGRALQVLGNPQVLALTATGDERVCQAIADNLGVEQFVFDSTARDNLVIDDQRNMKRRDRYLASLVAQGEKTIIYVNSRMESVVLARELRQQVPQMAPLIGFYNAGLTRAERTRIEELFRTGKLQTLVATSAFGEGVDIAGVRHVVLYHMPFSDIEFNQMSGRAGRDGDPATIHLLFGKGDTSINRSILDDAAPNHDDMAQIYRAIRAFQQESGDLPFVSSAEALAEYATRRMPAFRISPAKVKTALSVFRELELIQYGAHGDGTCTVGISHANRKVELTDSVRYHEGLDEIEAFAQFNRWVMGATLDALVNHIRHPLMPKGMGSGACLDIRATQLFPTVPPTQGQRYNAEGENDTEGTR